MTGIVSLEGLEFYAFHGCYQEERERGNKFIVHVHMHYDMAKAAASDKIDDAVNYVKVYELVKSEMEVPSHLLEHLANRIIDCILISFDEISTVEVKVIKKIPPIGGICDHTSVTLSKTR